MISSSDLSYFELEILSFCISSSLYPAYMEHLNGMTVLVFNVQSAMTTFVFPHWYVGSPNCEGFIEDTIGDILEYKNRHS